MLKTIILIDEGDYYDKDGSLSKSVGIDYYKCNEWSINPKVKGIDPNNEKQEGADPTAAYSIEGERYPTQNIHGRVLK